MPSTDTITVLNRVLALLRKSFPQYLQYARPYIPPSYADTWTACTDIAAGQDSLAERVGEQILAAGALPHSGEFPMVFTDTHDLSVDYLIREAIGYQQQDIAELESLSASPDLPPTAGSLVAEALGMAQGHLESLEQLEPQAGSSTIVRNGEPAPKND